MHLHDFALVVVAFFSEILGTLSGFGSSTFFVPAASFFESFRLVLALTALLHVFGNFSKILLFRKHFRLDLFLRLFLPSVLLTGVGAALSKYVATPLLLKALGVTLMLLPLLLLWAKAREGRLPKYSGMLLIAVSGFSTGLLGTGGALRGLALTALRIEKNSFVSLSAAIDMGGDLVRTTIYLAQGYMDWQQWMYIPLLGLAGFLGSLVGKRLLAKLNQSQFEKLVAVFVFVSGAAMVFS